MFPLRSACHMVWFPGNVCSVKSCLITSALIQVVGGVGDPRAGGRHLPEGLQVRKTRRSLSTRWRCGPCTVELFLPSCRDKGISSPAVRCLWFLQTFLFGFASLGLLLKYDPPRQKQH